MEQIPDIVHESWHQYLQPLFDDNKMKMIKYEILPKCKFYPSADNIFRVFQMPLNEIKVVILGQDPYPNGEANGLAFAVNNQTPIPKSLNIIFKEVIKPETSEEFVSEVKLKDKTLTSWHNQGVFLLNTALTVEAKNAGSHLGYWQWFTREVIKVIAKEARPIWLLWGAKAQGFRDYVSNYHKYDGGLIRSPLVNYGLEAPHPAAELYSGGKTTFSGCNHFKLCNEILTLQNQSQINW